MTLRLRFLDTATGLLIADTFTDKVSVSRGLGKSGEFSTQLSSNIDATQYIAEGNTVQIYYQGSLIMQGELQSFGVKLEDASTVSLKGRDVVDKLYETRAYSRALYKDKRLLLALTELLDSAGWAVGDISTLPDPTATVMVDLRGEKYVINQVNKLLEKIPQVTYRYGGYVAGKHTLDIGRFSQPSLISYYSPPGDGNVINESDGIITTDDITGFLAKLSFDTTLEEIYWGLEAWGADVQDNAGVKRTITLIDALRDDPTRAAHAQYPIIEAVSFSSAYMIDKARAPYPGGTIESLSPTGALTNVQLGNANGATPGLNVSHAFWFYPAGGKLSEIAFDSQLAGSGTITEPLTWWLHEAGTYPTPGALLATGLLNGGTWVASSRLVGRATTEAQQVLLESGREYCIIIGYERPAGYPISTFVRMAASSIVETRYTVRRAARTTDAGAFVIQTTPTVPFIVKTTPYLLPAGGTILETQRDIGPDKTEVNATLADLNAAGEQLWVWGQAFLQDHESNRTEYDLEINGDTSLPRLGDTVFVRGQAQGAVIDPYTGDSTPYTTQVEGNFRVDDMKLDFDNDGLSVNMKLTEGNGLTNQDAYVVLYDAVDKVDPPQGALPVALITPDINNNAGNVLNGDPDTTLSDGRAAKLFTFAYPTAPSLFYNTPILAGTPYGTAPRGTVYVEVVSRPDPVTLAGAVVKVCVERGWVYDDTASLTAEYYWT